MSGEENTKALSVSSVEGRLEFSVLWVSVVKELPEFSAVCDEPVESPQPERPTENTISIRKKTFFMTIAFSEKLELGASKAIPVFLLWFHYWDHTL